MGKEEVKDVSSAQAVLMGALASGVNVTNIFLI
jgi:hypothetical protein